MVAKVVESSGRGCSNDLQMQCDSIAERAHCATTILTVGFDLYIGSIQDAVQKLDRTLSVRVVECARRSLDIPPVPVTTME